MKRKVKLLALITLCITVFSGCGIDMRKTFGLFNANDAAQGILRCAQSVIAEPSTDTFNLCLRTLFVDVANSIVQEGTQQFIGILNDESQDFIDSLALSSGVSPVIVNGGDANLPALIQDFILAASSGN